ncbi:hypothetical protein CHUAL_011947 [Chamberlinius hualienensis]
MAGRVPQAVRQVKPLLSVDRAEAKRRVINLYKAWYRQIPLTVFRMDANVTVPNARQKLREIFEKNRNVTDIRTIDMLVIKGQMELMETAKVWKQPCHFLTYMKETVEPKPADFLSKFFAGQP